MPCVLTSTGECSKVLFSMENAHIMLEMAEKCSNYAKKKKKPYEWVSLVLSYSPFNWKELRQAHPSTLHLKWPLEACASNPQPTMSVFPGTQSALLNGQTWFARPGAAGLLFQLTLGRHLSLQKKKNKNNNNPTCRDRCAQSLVRESCSRNNVVLEPVGKTSLVLDTVFGHELEKE